MSDDKVFQEVKSRILFSFLSFSCRGEGASDGDDLLLIIFPFFEHVCVCVHPWMCVFLFRRFPKSPHCPGSPPLSRWFWCWQSLQPRTLATTSWVPPKDPFACVCLLIATYNVERKRTAVTVAPVECSGTLATLSTFYFTLNSHQNCPYHCSAK